MDSVLTAYLATFRDLRGSPCGRRGPVEIVPEGGEPIRIADAYVEMVPEQECVHVEYTAPGGDTVARRLPSLLHCRTRVILACDDSDGEPAWWEPLRESLGRAAIVRRGDDSEVAGVVDRFDRRPFGAGVGVEIGLGSSGPFRLPWWEPVGTSDPDTSGRRD